MEDSGAAARSHDTRRIYKALYKDRTLLVIGTSVSDARKIAAHHFGIKRNQLQKLFVWLTDQPVPETQDSAPGTKQ